MAVEGLLGNSLWCNFDSLRFLIERNPGSMVILVAIIGFLFYRLQKFLLDFLFFVFAHAPIGKKTKDALRQCRVRQTQRDREVCIDQVAVGWIQKTVHTIRWIFEAFLNLVALLLVALGAGILYLIISPPLSCAVPGNYGIFVPAVFKEISYKGGEFLYVDETNRSFVRIWPGKDREFGRNGPALADLEDKYHSKKGEASRTAQTKVFEIDERPMRGHDYFVLNWRDRDNFNVYFVARLVARQNGKRYIDSLEITSPAHGNALLGYDYKVLFCNFMKPSTADMTEECTKV
jgi:hypothetical protein